MGHEILSRYGIDPEELLTAIFSRLRLQVAVEGAIAEVHLFRHANELFNRGRLIKQLCLHDTDGMHDMTVWIDATTPIRIECKNVRNHDEAYRTKGVVQAYKVEVQKTRTSKGDKSSRFYGPTDFDLVAVNLGKKTGNWTEFLFVRSEYLSRHPVFDNKFAAMQRVPLPSDEVLPNGWYRTLLEALQSFSAKASE